MDTIKYVLSESEMPKGLYNTRADLPTPEDLAPLFCEELIKQEVSRDRFNAGRKIFAKNRDLDSLGIAIALAPLDRKRLHIIGLMPIGKLNLKLRHGYYLPRSFIRRCAMGAKSLGLIGNNHCFNRTSGFKLISISASSLSIWCREKGIIFVPLACLPSANRSIQSRRRSIISF